MAADRSQMLLIGLSGTDPGCPQNAGRDRGQIADGGGIATISLTNLAKLCGVSDSTAFLAQRQVDRGARLRQPRAGTTSA